MEIVSISKVNKMFDDIEVKSCPFCGESDEIALEEYKHVAGKRWKIFCCNCMAGIDRGYDQTPYGLVDAWNRRK